MVRVRSFEYEADMCATLSRQLARLAGNRFRVVRHLAVGAEIPDYVATYAPSMTVPRLSSVDCAVWSQLREVGPMRGDELADRLFSQRGTIDAALARLTKLGYASAASSSFAAIDLLSSARVIAIEAKLTRWRDALAQAVSYRRFSNASYVALPHDVLQARLGQFAQDCERTSVGLLAVRRGRITIEIPAGFHEPFTPDWVWTITRSLNAEVSAKRRTSGKRRASCVDDSSSFLR